MKKLTLFFLALIAVCLGFQGCDNSKTYAEMLEDEKNGISDFIRKIISSHYSVILERIRNDVSRINMCALAVFICRS